MAEPTEKVVRTTYTPEEAKQHSELIKQQIWERHHASQNSVQSRITDSQGSEFDPYSPQTVEIDIGGEIIAFIAEIMSGSNTVSVYNPENTTFDRGANPQDAVDRRLIFFEEEQGLISRALGSEPNNLRPVKPQELPPAPVQWEPPAEPYEPDEPPAPEDCGPIIQNLKFSELLDGKGILNDKGFNDADAMRQILDAAKELGVEPERYSDLEAAWGKDKFIKTADAIEALDALNGAYAEARSSGQPINITQKEILGAFLDKLDPSSFIVDTKAVDDRTPFDKGEKSRVLAATQNAEKLMQEDAAALEKCEIRTADIGGAPIIVSTGAAQAAALTTNFNDNAAGTNIVADIAAEVGAEIGAEVAAEAKDMATDAAREIVSDVIQKFDPFA